MLYAFGFERVGVVAGDLYFVDPRPGRRGPSTASASSSGSLSAAR
jgi:hypothetical protein